MFFDSIRMNLKRKVLPWSVIVLVVLQAALVLFSWIVASVWPYAELRSVLSGEGVRWYFGSFVDNMSCPLLVWLLLGFMAYGTYSHSGLRMRYARFGAESGWPIVVGMPYIRLLSWHA